MKSNDSFVHNLRSDFHMTQRTLAPVRFSDGLTGLPYQNIGVVIRKTEVEKRAETWLRLLRGVQRGISVWYDDPQLSKSVLAKYTRDKNAGTLEKTYGFFTKHWLPSRPHLYRSRLRTILRFFGSTVLPAAKDASPTQ